MKGGNRFLHNFGSGNTFVGEHAGNFSLSGPFNSAVGYAALQNNTTGNANTASGFLALVSNTIGNQNTASGSSALQSNTTGVNNTASGVNALYSNTTGGDNAAFGLGALNSNVTGTANTALGRHALFNSGKTVTAGAFVTGVPYTIQSVGTTNFTAIGASSNAVGTVFTATGAGSGTGTAASNTGNNTAIGYLALFNNETGVNNIAIGQSAGNTIGASGSNNMVIGNGGVAGDNSTIRLGDPAVHTKTLLAGNVGIGTNNPYSKLHVFGYGIANGIDLGDRADNPGTNSANIYLTPTGNGILSTVASKNGVGFGNVALQEFGGNVGIGTTTPTKARLEISGFVNTNLAAGAIINASNAGNPVGTLLASAGPLSLYADQGIAAPFFVAPSDERIKRIAGRSDATRDLATLAAIEVTDYTYLDTATKGTGKHKKVIARQVEGVYPHAVSRGTDVVPDIYAKAPVKGGWVNLATNLKKGERVRLIGNKKDAVHEVLEVAPGRFRTDFAADGDAVFVYGREVKDFRMVDYEAIAMLNVSATQELNRRIEHQAAEIAQLKTQLAMLAQLQAQVAAIAKANTTQIAYRPTSN